ncbi:MAG: hypothetical protein WCD04_03775 [Terriglobia bacterium]|jgi:hypothetical protein
MENIVSRSRLHHPARREKTGHFPFALTGPYRVRYLHRKIRAGETADLVNVLINKTKYTWWFDV